MNDRDVLESWHVTPSSNRDYHFLDGLRGVAILMVIVCHFIYTNPHSGRLVHFLGALFSAGAMGVPLFFSLSGFLISWPFWKAKLRPGRPVVPKGYGWRRFYKIYPPIAFSFLFLIPFYVWVTGDFSYITVALEWLVGLPLVSAIRGKVNPVMWTLVIEAQFYIVLPLVMLACRRLSLRTCLWLVPALFFVLGFGWRCLQLSGWIASYPFPAFIDSRFPTGLDFFAFGILVSGLHAEGKITRRHAPWAWAGVAGYLLALLALACLRFAGNESFFWGELITLGTQVSCAAMLLCIGNPAGLLPRVLSHAGLRWCGIVSYEWYLWHQPMCLYSRRFLGPAGGDVFKYAMILGVPLVLSIAVAAAAYRFVSLPILRFGRSRHQE